MIVLTYHKVKDAAGFEKQIRLLTSRYHVISLDVFISKLRDKSLEPNDVLITFDDGDLSVLDTAMPILSSYQCPAVLFVITTLIGTYEPFWWDEILYYTGDPGVVKKAKSIRNDARVKLLEELRKDTKKSRLTYRQLTVQELHTLEMNGINIANHSHTHPMFDKIDVTEIETELTNSTGYLRNNGFRFWNVFAYPNGNSFVKSENLLSKAGIEYAFLFDHQLITVYDNPYRLSRLSVNDSTSLWKLNFILTGWHSRILPMRRNLHKLFSGK